jgi:type IV pilus assembly protein PilC
MFCCEEKSPLAESKKSPRTCFENIGFLQPRVKESDVIIFARQFSTMIDAGLPLLQCLEILHAQQENPTFKKQLKKIKESVESGETFADALKNFPILSMNCLST